MSLAPSRRERAFDTEDLTKTAFEDDMEGKAPAPEVRERTAEEIAAEKAEEADRLAFEAKQRHTAEMDLFALCAELGEKGQQYDAESDAMVETFVRGEDCLECIRQISK